MKLYGSILSLGALGVCVAGCGDNQTVEEPEAPPACETTVPAGVAPTEGLLVDANAFPIAGCVEQGLVTLPGRWAVVDRSSAFTFDYPKFAGTCESGFTRESWAEDDHVLEPEYGSTFHTWTDGTKLAQRDYFRIDTMDGMGNPFVYEYASLYVVCMQADGTLAGVRVQETTDFAAPAHPVVGTRFGQREPELAKGLTLVGELGESNTGLPIGGLNLIVENGVAYVAGFLGFDVIDVSDPAAPVALSHVDGDFNDVRVVTQGATKVAYLADRFQDQVLIVNVTNPAQLVVAGSIPEFSHSLQVATVGNQRRLYFADYTETIPIYDITNPLVPTLIGMPAFGPTDPADPGGVHDLTVDGDRIYAYNTTRGVFAFDVSADLATTTPRGSLDTTYSHAGAVGTLGGREILLHGDEGMTPEGGAFMRILDGDDSSPTFMTELARFATRPEVGIHNIELVGDKAYVAYYHDGLRIIDLSDPTQPREVAHHNTWDFENGAGSAFEGAVGVRVVDGHVWVADYNRGLLVFREQ